MTTLKQTSAKSTFLEQTRLKIPVPLLFSFFFFLFPTPRSKNRIQSSRTEFSFQETHTISSFGRKSPDILPGFSFEEPALSGNAETRRHRSNSIAAYALFPSPAFDRARRLRWKQLWYGVSGEKGFNWVAFRRGCIVMRLLARILRGLRG